MFTTLKMYTKYCGQIIPWTIPFIWNVSCIYKLAESIWNNSVIYLLGKCFFGETTMAAKLLLIDLVNNKSPESIIFQRHCGTYHFTL